MGNDFVAIPVLPIAPQATGDVEDLYIRPELVRGVAPRDPVAPAGARSFVITSEAGGGYHCALTPDEVLDLLRGVEG